LWGLEKNINSNSSTFSGGYPKGYSPIDIGPFQATATTVVTVDRDKNTANVYSYATSATDSFNTDNVVPVTTATVTVNGQIFDQATMTTNNLGPSVLPGHSTELGQATVNVPGDMKGANVVVTTATSYMINTPAGASFLGQQTISVNIDCGH
jgi:hypothetical protein